MGLVSVGERFKMQRMKTLLNIMESKNPFLKKKLNVFIDM